MRTIEESTSFAAGAENTSFPDNPPPYRRPKLVRHGELGPLIRGASWKGIDSIGEIDPEQAYPS